MNTSQSTCRTSLRRCVVSVTWVARSRSFLSAARNMAFLFLLLSAPSLPCGPGRGGGRRRISRPMTPLVFKQHIPSVSENTLGASGQAEGAINRAKNPDEFSKLLVNNNPDIIFKDEEGTGDDRIMSPRCRDKLDSLAVFVMSRWPGVYLRVTEAWDSDGHHATNSLHYEGRAVDITTSDRDRAKYGMLARLAVEAGFDWVSYESRGHIHCSVKSESSEAVRIGGCFPASSTVITRDHGAMMMSELRVGHYVMTQSQDGRMLYTKVISFMDRRSDVIAVFLTIHTENGEVISLTDSHHIYARKECSSKKNQTDSWKKDCDSSSKTVVFARDISVGDFVYTTNNGTNARASRVVATYRVRGRGIYAPLTNEGTLVVDGVLVSCYALFTDFSIPHKALAPYRAMYRIADSLLPSRMTRLVTGDSAQVGMHWYTRLLYELAKILFPKESLLL